jgi:ubiquinone/menaquinone biosynthesis C-methylase UbiE
MQAEGIESMQNQNNVSRPRFASYYNWSANRQANRRWMDPQRAEIISKAYGVVLEVGAGSGLNFSFYQPEKVVRVEASEPDRAMLDYARVNLQHARVPISLTQAPAEALPFPEKTFDSVVSTLVFCSVKDQARSLAEIQRVLKPGGALLMLEHVRSHNAIVSRLQDLLVPFTTRVMGNCHWNRDTLYSVEEAGFKIQELHKQGGIFVPFISLVASRDNR